MKLIGFALHWPCDPSQGLGQWKWFIMVEVNGAYKHDRYKQIWSKSLHVVSNIKVFATQNQWTSGQTDECN